MTMIDNLTSEMGSRFGIGARAQPLMREFLQLMTGGPGGLSGFLDRFRNAGMGAEVSSYLGGRTDAELPPKTVDAVLGDATVEGISQRVGLAPSVVSSAAGFEIPKLIGFLTPGGRLPNALPREVQSFVSSSHEVPPIGATVDGATEHVRAGARVPPMAAETAREPPRRSLAWIWILGLLALAALAGWLFSQRPRATMPRTPTLPPVTAPIPTGPATSATTPAPEVAPATASAVSDLNAFLNRTVLNFPTGSAVLPAAAEPTFRQAAVRIKGLPAGTVIEIAGHTDNTGNADANLALSQRRAEAVRDALVRDGVSPTMLTARGYGATQPAASNDTAEGRAQNRRIAFSVAGQATTNPAGRGG